MQPGCFFPSKILEVASGNGTILVPDLLTPIASNTLARVLSLEFGTEVGEDILRIAKSAVSSIEEGNFTLQVELGKEIYVHPELPPPLRATGAYFMAEGYRLQMASRPSSEKTSFLKRAEEMYAASLGLSGENPRALRGLGRVAEMAGDYSKALGLYTKARESVSAGLANSAYANQHPMMVHELLRISRHRINCLSSMENAATRSSSNRQTLELLLEETESLHLDHLVAFRAWPKWMQLEWFMALVFIGRAWGSLGNDIRMSTCLTSALHCKRTLMSARLVLTPVDRENLTWWVSVANECSKKVPKWELVPLIQRMDAALTAGADLKVLQSMRELIRKGLPPNFAAS